MYWVFIIFCMMHKKWRKQEHSNPIVRLFINVMNVLRENTYIVVAGIFTWAIFMPPTLKMLGFGPHHLKIASFNII